MTHSHNDDGAVLLPCTSKRLLFFFCRNMLFFACVAGMGIILAFVFNATNISLYHPLIHQAVPAAGAAAMPPTDEFKMRITLYIFYLVFLFVLILVVLALFAGSATVSRLQKQFSIKKLGAVVSIYRRKMVFIYKQFKASSFPTFAAAIIISLKARFKIS